MLEKMVVKQFKYWHCCHSIEYPSQVTWLFIWNGVNVTVVFLAKIDKIKSPYSIHRRWLSFVESKENTKQMLDEKWNEKKSGERMCKRSTVGNCMMVTTEKALALQRQWTKRELFDTEDWILSTKLTWFKSSKDMIKFHFTWLDPTHSNEQYPPLRLIIQKRAFDFVAQSKARRFAHHSTAQKTKHLL